MIAVWKQIVIKRVHFSMETSQDFCENNMNIRINDITVHHRRNSNDTRNERNALQNIEVTLVKHQSAQSDTDEPMDLTFSQKNLNININNTINPKVDDKSDPDITNTENLDIQFVQAKQLLPGGILPKKRGRKRKDSSGKMSPSIKIPPLPYDQNQDYLQAVDSRKAEVLMAAKSLFSKRTRTLYHWMYPNTPKAQLKSAVSLSWETLGVQEKEFYVSQVLGRFGFPQSSLMVNPQLGALRGVPMNLSSTSAQSNVETSNAVSTILVNSEQPSEAGCSWSQYANLPQYQMRKMSKKRGRLNRPSGKMPKMKPSENMRAINVENIEDFQDDPELRKEFEQFKWALHMSDK